jgi:hypothetical protein
VHNFAHCRDDVTLGSLGWEEWFLIAGFFRRNRAGNVWNDRGIGFAINISHRWSRKWRLSFGRTGGGSFDLLGSPVY